MVIAEVTRFLPRLDERDDVTRTFARDRAARNRSHSAGMRARRTKIVATLGPATDAPGVLDELLEAGMDCARLNCSHGDADALRRRAAEVRAAAQRHGRPVGLLFDLQGPKLRLAGDVDERQMAPGDEVTFVEPPYDDDAGPGCVRVDFAGFGTLVTERSEIVIGDGVPRFSVSELRVGQVVARTVSPGRIAPRKGINVTFARPELPALTEKDAADLALAAELQADFVALSFVRGAADMEELRQRLRAHGSTARTIAKVEKVEAYQHLDEILGAADGVMVARGDYGVEAGVARVPLMQKDTIFRATQRGKFVITATQMLESMINTSEPTRAEAADVANAVIDGTSAVMLSAETSVGSYPVRAVQAMAEIACAAEESPVIHGRAQNVEPETAAGAVMHAAVELAEELDAQALVVPTSTGGAPRACAKYRHRRPIVAPAHDPAVANQLTLEWGVYPTPMPVAETVDEMIDSALVTARDVAGLPTGAIVVLTAGRQTGTPGATNLIMVREIP
jgi:pyruvate kinase